MKYLLPICTILILFNCKEEPFSITENETIDSLISIDTLITADSVEVDDSLDIEDGPYEILSASSSLYGIKYELSVPKGWVYIERIGIDSFVGTIAGPADTLVFDYGYWRSSFGQMPDDEYEKWKERITGGYVAEISRPLTEEGRYHINIKDIDLLVLDDPRYDVTYQFSMYETATTNLPDSLALHIFRSFKPVCFYETDECYLD